MADIDTRIKGTGANIDTEAQVDPSFNAFRASLRPLDHQNVGGIIGGHYRVGLKTGAATVIAAAGAIFSARWSDPTRLMVVQRVMVGFNITTGFTTAQVIDLDLVPVRGFSVADTGGTAIALGTSNKKRFNMNNSLVADMRIATTAALGAGTGTADANALALASCGAMNANNAIGGFSPLVPLLDSLAGQEHPLVLAANEGFRIRIATTMGAAGVGNFSVAVDWAEVPSF